MHSLSITAKSVNYFKQIKCRFLKFKNKKRSKLNCPFNFINLSYLFLEFFLAAFNSSFNLFFNTSPSQYFATKGLISINLRTDLS